MTDSEKKIVLDIETTGLELVDGNRIIEIYAVVLVNDVPTDESYHQRINPEREVEPGAVKVHGLTLADLVDSPKFAEIADDFLEFIGDAQLIIHNAPFDMGYINMELARIDRPEIPMTRVIDTLLMARQKSPGAPASLDALCKRFEVKNFAHAEGIRDVLKDRDARHAAETDVKLLAKVYVALIGGQQRGLELAAEGRDEAESVPQASAVREARPPRSFPLSDAEAAGHEALVDQLTDPIWHTG